jgi:hypothetical protein
MKDYSMGSEEFLIGFYEILQWHLTTCAPISVCSCHQDNPGGRGIDSKLSPGPTLNGSSTSRSNTLDSYHDHGSRQEGPDEDIDRARQPMDEGLCAHDKLSGRTDLHFMNILIYEITNLHSSIEREIKKRKEKRLTGGVQKTILSPQKD